MKMYENFYFEFWCLIRVRKEDVRKIIVIKMRLINKYPILRYYYIAIILLTKTTAAQNGVALSYHSERGLYFLAVVFTSTVLSLF